MQIAGFVVDEQAQELWRWLKWLPHVDPLASVLPTGALAKDEATAGELLGALEQLLFVRQKAAKIQIRSFQKRDHAPDSPVNELPNTPSIVVVVIDKQLRSAHKSRLITLGEQGPDVGIHLLWVAGDINDVPAACRTFVAVEHDQYMSEAIAQVGYVRHRNTVMLSQLSLVTPDDATKSAKTLAGVHDLATRVLDESDLPRTVNLQDLHSLDILAGAKPILQNWSNNTSIKREWGRLQQQPEISLRAVIGQGEKHPLEVELRKHGPHALVGGTTGSGKSEFLQSWIMSLAANFSPDCLTFLLVDYKGGAAFAECVELPHTVGLVTDLTPHLVKRALTSLRAELKYREEVIAAYGVKDLQGLEARGITDAPPCLVIVIDEFAALATEVPEFVDGVIDIAQRGRSLGLHLIMATQRPAGVIKDNLRANTNLRVALRMADPDDSSDVIGVKDAAFFDVETPGRAALKIGAARLQHFQSAYLGGRNGNEKVKSPITFRAFDFVEGETLAALDSDQKSTTPGEQKPRDIEVLRDAITEAAVSAGIAKPRRPWLDPLPTQLSVAELETHLPTSHEKKADRQQIYIGLADHPDSQSQKGIGINLSKHGNIAFFGSSGTGKTSVLLTISALLSTDAANRPVHIYGIDAASGGLSMINDLPTVGAVAQAANRELVERILDQLQAVITERADLFAEVGAGDVSEYGRVTGKQLPLNILLIDGFNSFGNSYGLENNTNSPLTRLLEIMQAGRAFGVHVVLTSDRFSSLSGQFNASVQQRFVMRLANPTDYAYFDVDPSALDSAPAGRALESGEGKEIQFAYFGASPLLVDQASELGRLARELRSCNVLPAPRIVVAPLEISLSDLPKEVEKRPVIGIDVDTLAPLGAITRGLLVINGGLGAGKSTAVRAAVAGQLRSRPGLKLLLLTAEELSESQLANAFDWDHIFTGEEEVLGAAKQLCGELREATGGSSSGVKSSALQAAVNRLSTPADPAAGADVAGKESERLLVDPANTLIVFEGVAEPGEISFYTELGTLAKLLRRSAILSVFEFANISGSSHWNLTDVLKHAQMIVSLRPDGKDSGDPFCSKYLDCSAADYVVGRGIVLTGKQRRKVHIALA